VTDPSVQDHASEPVCSAVSYSADTFMAAVVLQGALDTRRTELLNAALADLCGSSRHVLVDLTAVTSVDAAVLSLLVGADQRLEGKDGFLVLMNPSRAVTASLRAIAEARPFPIFSDQLTALGWLHCVDGPPETAGHAEGLRNGDTTAWLRTQAPIRRRRRVRQHHAERSW
jgi:anti-anti-sigma factor